METDFRYYFQHPYFRLFTAYFVTLCNFLIYAEDPVAHSRKESNVPVIGNCFAFVGTKYPPNAWSLLKVVLWLSGTVVGLIIGKLFFHTFLFNKIFRLRMFNDDKGSWMTMFMTTIVSVFIFSYIYNLFLLIGTWCGDFFTAWMVTDMMLQEKLYPLWAKKPRAWWNTGIRRIILFWIIVAVSSFIVIFVIATDYIQWDKLNHDFLHSNEVSRAFLASFILVMDIVIVMQDWDFPHFISAIDIKMPGVNTAHIRFKIPRLLRRLEYYHVHISGKWFNYGILFIVILLDLNMWKNQIFYSPFDYGQYVDSEGRIHSVNDEFSLENFNETLLSFDYRNATIDPITGKRYIELDNVMNARYNDYSVVWKAFAFIPSIGIFILFGVLIWKFGRSPKPTKEDPYGGRLKKRKRRRFSARRTFRSFRKQTAAMLTAFRWRREARGRAVSRERQAEDGVDGARGDTGDGAVEMTVETARGDTGDGAVEMTVETERGAKENGNGGAGDAPPQPLRTVTV
ncbi:hypothetical protein BaRGS_00040046 [Batillaria attramentaria]|uniref:Transmembrane protein 117 n=1 Tax=Batillaria attramentaria TaxID=370345 RepID=A0ABD0J1N5_9CAEN